MTVWYSDHYGADGDNDTSKVSPPLVVPVGIKHARIRYARATITGMPLAADVLRFMTLRSGDRLLELMISSDGGSTAAALNFGIYLAGNAHDGAVKDADLFASAQAISTAIERTSIFLESGTPQHEDHGKRLWELLALGDGDDTVDPVVLYDICGVVSTAFTDADSIMTLEAYYTAGD